MNDPHPSNQLSTQKAGPAAVQAALVVIDMQRGMLDGTPKPINVDKVVDVINHVAAAVRQAEGRVIHIQHHGSSDDAFTPRSPGWQFLPNIDIHPKDLIIPKKTCDAFYQTSLHATLKDLEIEHLIIGGWATDFCVDTTIRAAASLNYAITVIKEGHTLADRTHLTASQIIEHHHHTWHQLIVPGPSIRVIPSAALCKELECQSRRQGDPHPLA